MDKLPEEILIEIFSYLKFKELCQLTTTCESFNDIISNNSSLMNEFRLIHTKNNDISVDFRMKRKYQRILIETVDDNLMKFLKCCGDNICDIIIQCEEIELKDLRRIFTFCQNVKKFNTVRVCKITYSDAILPMPGVKLAQDFLIVYYYGVSTFKLLQISSKNIRVIEGFLSSRHFNDAHVDFLKSQKHLKTLYLDEDSSAIFRNDSLANVDFQLETFIAYHYSFYEVNDKNFKKFLENQKSLRKINIYNYNCHERSYNFDYAKILGNFKNIKELKIPFPCKLSHYMPYIERLAIKITCLHKTSFNFHSIFPNVNYLCIDTYFKIKFVENFTETASEDYAEFKFSENVKTLKIKNVVFENDSLFADDVDINIENLTIYKSDNINWLIEFFKNDRIKLKSLTVEGTNMKKSQREYFESLTRGENKKIEKLKIYMPMKFNENHDYVCNYALNN